MDERSAGDGRSDAELLSSGDPEDFGRFYDRHARALLAFFSRRTASADLAADLAAETFAQAFWSRGRYRDTGAPASAWLLGIARHTLNRSLRRRRVDDRARRRLGMERVALDEASYERIEELADFGPMRDAIREAMASLSPKLARAVTLRVGHELPYPEVAQRLRISEAAARVRVARGLARLSDLLEVQ
ncbi:MAG: RNA polymerase sigma factor [Actinobacteria bacterium]|nr:RNA polymerase sigma factor [Actinomycetota bacterium]